MNMQNNNSLSDWLSYIESIYPTKYDLSLDRIKLVVKKNFFFNFSCFIITVSGTNGKGTVCSTLERFFLDSGYTVGLYSSPHLINYYERIRINGEYLKDPEIHINSFKIIELLRKDIPLTYFEFITLSAFLIFKDFSLDIIILEVGIGGRLDATNILDTNLAIVTNIELDHINVLGNNRNKIGFEKSGIFRKSIYAVLGDRFIPYSVYQTANFLKTKLIRIGYEWDWKKNNNGTWNFYDIIGTVENLPISNFSISNIALALSALRISKFEFNTEIFKNSIRNIFLKGRFQTIFLQPHIIVDVAHNPHAAIYLSNELKELLLKKKKNTKLYAVIGMASDKDIKNTIFPLLNIIDFWYYTPLQTHRSVDKSILKNYLPKDSIECLSIDHALNILIRKVNLIDIVLIFGSFYAVSEALLSIKKINF